MDGFAWVTLATNDSYSLGALVLAHSLKQVGTAHQLAVLVTPGVTGVMRQKLATVFNVVKEVNILDSRDEANLRLLKRPELGITFTKLHCWRLTQFEKCVFLDADTMVLANADELFDREEFSAAPDVGWPDCFNSGVFVYRPSEETYSKLVQFAIERGSFDGGDQGLLNLYFSDWAHKDISKHLPFIYNMCSTACYSYLPAFKQFGPTVKIIHFIGNTKPWLQYFDSETQHVQVVSDIQHLQGVVQQWWNIFCSCIHPMLSPEMPTSRAPTTVHFPSYPYVEYALHRNSSSDNSFYNTEEHKSDYRNVFDPWEEYENKLDNPDQRQENINRVSYSENNSANVVDHYTKEWHPYVNSDYSTDAKEQNVVTNSFLCSSSSTSNTDNIYNIPDSSGCIKETNCDSNPDSVRHEFDISDNYSSNHSHTEPSLQPSSPKINSSSSTSDPALECKQLARPHECEPTSSVTNENALHDHPNEVHDDSAGLAGAFARLTIGMSRTPEQAMLEDQLRRQGWEVGNIDYMGRDSFDNIWSKICETLNVTPPGQSNVTPTPADPSEAAAVEAVAAKQAISKPIESTMKVTEEKTVIEKEQSEPIASSEIDCKLDDVPVPQFGALVLEPSVTAQPVVPSPIAIQPAVPTPQLAVSEPQLIAPALELVAPALEPVVPTLEPVAPTLEPVAPTLEPVASTLEPVAPTLETVASTLEPIAPTLEPVPPALALAIEPVVPALQPVAPTPTTQFQSAIPAPESVTPAAQPATTAPKSAVPAPQPATCVVVKKENTQSESPDPVSKQAFKTEPPKSEPAPSQQTVTVPIETTKSSPSPKSKNEKSASQADASKVVTESSKTSVNVSKPISEQAAGQKATPQSPLTKQAAQLKAETTSAEGPTPTPPPRKQASGQTASGAKKHAKGKK